LQNQEYLFDTVIEESSLTLKQDFLDGTLTGFEFFSLTFGQALKVAVEKNFKNLTILDSMTKIETQFQGIFNKNIDKSTLKDNQKIADEAIDEFLNRLLYVTKLKNEDLQNEINSQFGEIFKGGDIGDISAKIELRLRTWLMDRSNKELTKNKFEEFITKIAENLKLIIRKDEAFRDMLHFESILPDISDFQNPENQSQYRILHLRTSEEETHYAAMRVVSNYSDPLLFLKARFTDGDFEQIVIFFEKLCCYKLLVIELYKDSHQNFKKHENSLMIILQNDPSKKLVVIGDPSLKVNFQNMLIVNEDRVAKFPLKK
jgi:hypothetical protein